MTPRKRAVTPPPADAPSVPAVIEPTQAVPLIADTVPGNAVVLLVGTPGSGRTSLLCEWATAVATGDDWNGHPVERRKVIYLDASKEQTDIADTIEAIAGREVPPDWLRVFPARVNLTGDNLVPWLSGIRSFDPGLVVLDELGYLGRPSGGIDHPTWAVAVSTFAQQLFDVTAPGGSVVLAHTCDARGAIVGAPLGDGVDVTLRLGRVSGRASVRAMGPARSGRRRAPAPTAQSALASMMLERYGEAGSWANGEWRPGWYPDGSGPQPT
ncbi:MAG TPA: AAA family ATPase [Dermatophilaceae bacterium]